MRKWRMGILIRVRPRHSSKSLCFLTSSFSERPTIAAARDGAYHMLWNFASTGDCSPVTISPRRGLNAVNDASISEVDFGRGFSGFLAVATRIAGFSPGILVDSLLDSRGFFRGGARFAVDSRLPPARAAIATTEKICLIIRARRWAATAMSGTRGACVVSADQAPHRARSMRARGGDIFNGVMSQMPLSCDYDT